MTLSVYIFLLAFKIISTLLCAVFCWKIAHLKYTPTLTYMLFFSAFSLRVGTQLLGVFYTQDILGFLKDYDIKLVISTQGIEVLITTLFLVGILRKWTTYKHLPVILNGNKK